MDHNLEEFSEPVSPSGRFFNTPSLCAYIFGFLESEIPIDDSQTIYLLKHVFLPINPRFSSIMVKDEDEEMRWKQVEVSPQDHIKVPTFPKSSSEFYDQYFDEYVTKILNEKTPQDKPLWEVHVIKYPTTNASGTLIFKLHHALGDGYTLMGALLSCLQSADDPSVPLSFPSRKPSSRSEEKSGFFERLSSRVLSFFNSLSDFGWSVAKSSMVEDDESPIRRGEEFGVEFQPCVISNMSFSLDHMKKIKSKLGVTLNDVITGVIFYGIRLYMQEIDEEARKANSTGLVLLSTRNIGSYQSVQDMMKADSKSPWGNHISFLHVSIPKLKNQSSLSDPLEFVWKAQKIIKRKRNSFTVFLIEWLLDLELKLRGHEAVAKHIYGTLRNSSVVMSNLIGPVEPMALANHPIKGLYFTMTGGPESINIGIMSYTKTLRVTLKTHKDFIDEHKFKICMVNAFEAISKAAMETPFKGKD